MNNVSLKEVSEVITKGTTPSSVGCEFTNEGINFIKSESITDSKFLNNLVYEHIDKLTDDKLKRSRLKSGDLLVSIAGAYLGKIAIVQSNDLPANTNQAVGIVRLNRKLVDINYVYYYFSQKNIISYINNLSAQSSQPNLNLDLLGKLEFNCIDIQIQIRIAKVLSDIDAKIELNKRFNNELEAMTKMLYDYWFVQFDFPDTNGNPYKSSGGKMVWNEELKREIPEGWEVKTLLDIANFVNGLACQKFRPNENEDSYRVIKIREMGTGFTENSEFVSKKIPEKVVVHNGDILFSWSATLDVKMWTGGTGGLNQHIFKVTSKKYPKSYYYFELLNYLQHFKMMAELRKTTMGHITQDHLKESRITIPPMDLINKLDGIIKPILEKKVKLEEENQALASLRDWLLPMLMNGQVTVGDEKNIDDMEKQAIKNIRKFTGYLSDKEPLRKVAEKREKYGK